MFILDTNVISAVQRPDRSQKLADWLRAQPNDSLYTSVISIGDIALQEPKSPGFTRDLRDWLTRTELLYQDRILPFTAADARVWGQLSAKIGRSGADLMIAATALSQGATVITGNIAGFAPTGVDLIDPF